MSRLYTWLVGGASALALNAAAAQAQPQAQTNLSSQAQTNTPAAQPVARPGDQVTGEVIVTAQRRSENLERTPVAVEVLSGTTLTKQAITSDRDLQIAAPGLTVKGGQNGNQLNYSLRGQTVDSFTSSLPAVLPYVNEVEVGGAGQSAFYDLQSIQVLKGPQGTLFGRNATGGAVLFTTAKPTEDTSGYMTARFGNYSNIDLEGAISGAIIPDKLLVRIAGTYHTRDGYQQNIYPNTTQPELGGFDRQGLRISVTAKPTTNLTNDLVVDYFQDRGLNTVAPVYNVVPVANNVPGNPFVPNNVYFPGLVGFGQQQAQRGPYVVDVDSLQDYHIKKWVMSDITSYKINDSLTFRNILGFVQTSFFDAGDIDGTPFGIDGRGSAASGLVGAPGIQTQYSEEPQFLGKLFDNRVEYVVGGYADSILNQTTITSFIESGLGAPPQVNQGTTTSKSYAGYGQGTWNTGFYGFKLIGGVRYTSERVELVRGAQDLFSPTNPQFSSMFASGQFISPQKDTFSKVSYTAGAENQINPNLLLYITSRRSFRSGGFNLYTPPTPGFAATSGGEFAPEVATDIEGGAKLHGRVADMPVTVNLAVYNTWIDDIQRAYYEAIFGSLAAVTVNVPNARVTGFELDGSLHPTHWLTIGGNLNYTNAEFTNNQVAVLGTNGTSTTAAFTTYPDTPTWSGLVFADVTVPVSNTYNANVHGDVFRQTGDYFDSTGLSLNPGSKIPAYTVANFRVGLDPASGKGLSVAGVIKNAFDTTYYTGGIGFASLFALNTALPAEPRTYSVELSYRF